MNLHVIGMGGVNFKINLEKIISLKPDLIIAGYISKQRADLITKKTGIPVVVISYGWGTSKKSSNSEGVIAGE